MRIAIASILVAVVLFMFGFVWWGLLMGVVRPANVITDEPLIEQMNASLGSAGLYIHPDYASHEQDSPGPMTLVYFSAEAPSMPLMMGTGFLHMLVTACIASLLVSRLSIVTFNGRLCAVFCLGLFAALWADVGNAIWWHHPLPWMVFHIGYDVCSWLLAGLVIAAIVKPAASNSANEM